MAMSLKNEQTKKMKMFQIWGDLMQQYIRPCMTLAGIKIGGKNEVVGYKL